MPARCKQIYMSLFIKSALALVTMVCSNGHAISSEAADFRYAQTMYKERRMDAFFGASTWVRIKHWSIFSAEQKDRWLSLELTALARHCRWSDVERLYSAEGQGLALAEEAMSLIRMKEAYRRYRIDVPASTQTIAAKIDRSRENWSASADEYRKFTSPRQLRVHVESLCRE